MGQTFATPDYDVDSVAQGFADMKTRTDTLRSAFSGATAPSSPVVGQFWLDNSGTPNILKQYLDVGSGSEWVEICTVKKLNSDLEANFKQLKEARLQNRAAVLPPQTGYDGHAYYLTSDGEIYFADFTVDNATKKICAVIPGTTLGTVQIPLAGFQLDATNPPTIGTKGTTPTVRGLLFDAANELALIAVRVPANYSEDGDLTLRLACVLNQAETNGDDVDWSADLRAVDDGEEVDGTSTAVAASLTDIGASSGEGALIECDLTLDYDDADNPIAAGDWLFIEIHRTDLAEVGGVILTHATLVYPVAGAIT